MYEDELEFEAVCDMETGAEETKCGEPEKNDAVESNCSADVVTGTRYVVVVVAPAELFLSKCCCVPPAAAVDEWVVALNDAIWHRCF